METFERFVILWFLLNLKTFSFANATIYNNQANVVTLRKFPIYEEDIFVVSINSNVEKFEPQSVIVAEGTCKNKEVEVHFLYPGFMQRLPKRKFGEYFIITDYEAKGSHISISLKFLRKLDGCIFALYLVNTRSMELRKDVEDNLFKHPKAQIASWIVSLHLHWTIEMQQRTLDHRRDGFHAGHESLIWCKASNGRPSDQVKMLDTSILKEMGKFEEISLTNEIVYRFVARIEDHGKVIKCKAGADVSSMDINVFHHPSELIITPPLSNGYISNGSTVLCSSPNGFPRPKVQWTLVKAPFPDYNKYFTITNKGQILNLAQNIPQGSKWSFKCSSTNIIPASHNKGVSETFEVIIGTASLATVWIVLIVCILIILTVGLILLFYCRHSGKVALACCKTTLEKSIKPQYSDTIKQPLHPIKFDMIDHEANDKLDHNSTISKKSIDNTTNSRKSIESNATSPVTVKSSSSNISESKRSLRTNYNPIDTV